MQVNTFVQVEFGNFPRDGISIVRLSKHKSSFHMKEFTKVIFNKLTL